MWSSKASAFKLNKDIPAAGQHPFQELSLSLVTGQILLTSDDPSVLISSNRSACPHYDISPVPG